MISILALNPLGNNRDAKLMAYCGLGIHQIMGRYSHRGRHFLQKTQFCRSTKGIFPALHIERSNNNAFSLGLGKQFRDIKIRATLSRTLAKAL
jgi:hypothetical protein